jgi:hypothetical protein
MQAERSCGRLAWVEVLCMKKTLLTLVAVLGFCVGQSAQAQVSFGIPLPFPFLVWTPSGYSGQGYYGNCGQGGYSGSYYNYPNVGYYGYSGGYYPYPYATGYYRSYYNGNGYYRPYWRRAYNNGYYRRGYYGQRYYYRRGQ